MKLRLGPFNMLIACDFFMSHFNTFVPLLKIALPSFPVKSHKYTRQIEDLLKTLENIEEISDKLTQKN